MSRMLVLTTLMTLSLAALAQRAPAPASPEMARLTKALGGDWKTKEVMERSPDFPAGGGRTGRAHGRLAAGGNVLFYEVHSNGSAGELDGMLIFWWNQPAQVYGVIACFNSVRNACIERGTARWVGNSLVNDYDVTARGATSHWRDTFTFGSGSHTLVAAEQVGAGMQTRITSTARRFD